MLVVATVAAAQREIGSMLAEEEVVLYFAEDLAEALRLLTTSTFACVLLATGVDTSTDRAALRLIKAVDPSLPIIVTADRGSREREMAFCRESVFSYQVLGLDGEQLRQAVLHAASQGSRRREGR